MQALTKPVLSLPLSIIEPLSDQDAHLELIYVNQTVDYLSQGHNGQVV